MNRIFILLVFSFFFSGLYGQDTLQTRLINGFGVSYYGENLSHYGLQLSTEYSLWNRNIKKAQSEYKIIHKRKEFFVIGNIGGYIHKQNHVAVFLNGEIGYRKIFENGLKYELLLGLGYLHTYLQGNTYEVSDDGDVTKVNLAGQSNLMVPVSFGIGYDFNILYDQPFSINIRPGFFVQYPYNIAVAFRPTVDIGFYYYLNK